MSRKAKTVGLLVFVLLLLGATAGGAYFYYQYKAKQLVSELLQQFAPIAEVSVDSIAVDFEGKVQLDRVQIAPRGYKDVFSIDKIELIAEDALALFSSDEWFKEQLPSNLNLRLTGIIFSLAADFVSGTDNKGKQNNLRSIWGQACADENSFVSLTDKLGFTKLQLDGQIKIDSDESKKVLRTAISLNAPGLVRGFFEVDLASKIPLNFHERAILSQTEVSNMLLNVTDIGFNIKRLKYCAKQESISESSYPDFLKAAVNLKMMSSLDDGAEELDKSVMKFFKPRANVVFRLSPKDPLYLPIIFGPRFDILKAKGLSLTVSGKRVSTRYLPLLRGQIVEDNELQLHAEEEVLLANIKEKVSKKVKEKKGPRFTKVSIDILDQFEGKEVRLQTLLGKELDGVLLKVQGEKIIMRRRVEQGLVTYPVMKHSIESIKVYL